MNQGNRVNEYNRYNRSNRYNRNSKGYREHLNNVRSANMEYAQYTSGGAVAIRTNGRRNRAYVCQIQRYFIISFLAVVLTILGVILGSNLLASSQSKASNEMNTYKYYTSIEVQKGDTLWTIAEQYADDDADYASYIEEVKEMNQLTSDTIHAGEYLTVSYSSSEFK